MTNNNTARVELNIISPKGATGHRSFSAMLAPAGDYKGFNGGDEHGPVIGNGLVNGSVKGVHTIALHAEGKDEMKALRDALAATLESLDQVIENS